MKVDNTTLAQKVALRQALLPKIPRPLVLETHGGLGRVWARCYHGLDGGVVVERNAEKAEQLARVRPSWAVYEADSVKAVAAGVGSDRPITFVDIDPYGSCWEVVEALFRGAGAAGRPWPDVLGVVVNDGLRQSLSLGTGWRVAALGPALERWPTHRLHAEYLDVCRFLLAHHAAAQGYAVDQWHAYHCGAQRAVTHWAAVLRRR